MQLLLPRRRQPMDSALEEAQPQRLPASSLVHLLLLVPRPQPLADSALEALCLEGLVLALRQLLLLLPQQPVAADSALEAPLHLLKGLVLALRRLLLLLPQQPLADSGLEALHLKGLVLALLRRLLRLESLVLALHQPPHLPRQPIAADPALKASLVRLLLPRHTMDTALVVLIPTWTLD